MSDKNQSLNNQTEGRAVTSDDLDDLYDSDDDYGPPNDLIDLSETLSEISGTKADGQHRQERFWMILTAVAFGLAVLTSLLLVPTISTQQQRTGQTAEIISKLSLTNTAAAQALTTLGHHEPVKTSISSLEVAVDGLVAPSSFYETLAAALFGNRKYNDQVTEHWVSYKAVGDQFMSHETQVSELKQQLSALTGEIGESMVESIDFIEAVAKEGRSKNSGNAKNRYLFLTSEASNLNGILGRISSSVRNYFEPGQDLAQLSDAQSGLMIQLQDNLNRIISNSAAVVSTAAQPLKNRFDRLESRILAVGDRAAGLTQSLAALSLLDAESEKLSEALNKSENQSALVSLLGQISTYLPVIFVLIGVYALWRFFALQSRDLVESEGKLSNALADQQESILKLLDEMSALADGDLTVEAEVTDQITGAIADSVNFAVIEMRELVSQINRASVEVANESELAVSNAQAVSRSNIRQADEITSAASDMQKVTSSIRKMSEQASSSAELASESSLAATRGAQAVRDTIKGMEDMREQIQDTSKRIKRLGESSQRIGDIVALIDDIAEQTNILSLNAAIQASMAGEAGRGFAVVSDEVQSLAERSTEATKKIAELVATIQNDTNDAVMSMEKATQQVISGTKVADTAGSALAEIESVSKKLSTLIETISERSREQAQAVTNVATKVTLVRDSSSETSRKAQNSANSIAKLLELAKELETSVSRFKLPAS